MRTGFSPLGAFSEFAGRSCRLALRSRERRGPRSVTLTQFSCAYGERFVCNCSKTLERSDACSGSGVRWLVRFLVRFRCRLLAPRVRESRAKGAAVRV